MRANGELLNAQLMKAVTELGHGESICIADAGLPIPATVPVVDLSLIAGIPSVLDVLTTLRQEMSIESATIADALQEGSPEQLDGIFAQLAGTPLERIPHEELKGRLSSAKLVIRTGECTPFANVLLYGGVTF